MYGIYFVFVYFVFRFMVGSGNFFVGICCRSSRIAHGKAAFLIAENALCRDFVGFIRKGSRGFYFRRQESRQKNDDDCGSRRENFSECVFHTFRMPLFTFLYAKSREEFYAAVILRLVFIGDRFQLVSVTALRHRQYFFRS